MFILHGMEGFEITCYLFYQNKNLAIMIDFFVFQRMINAIKNRTYISSSIVIISAIITCLFIIFYIIVLKLVILIN